MKADAILSISASLTPIRSAIKRPSAGRFCERLMHQLKIFGNFHRKVDGSGPVVLVNSRGQDARLDVDRHRIEIVCRREQPPIWQSPGGLR